MNVLLDTHVALWAITDSHRLCQTARKTILSPTTTVWISAASIWEIAIKHRLARGDMPVSGKQAQAHFQAAGYRFLAIAP
jgi:PIN domain nuclease of toxin-antitoxin system